MSVKKMVLWSYADNRLEEKSLLIDPEELVNKIPLNDELAYLFPDLEVSEENQAMLESLLEGVDYYEIEELLDEEGIKYEIAGDSEESKSMLVYFADSKVIVNLEDCEAYPVYEYWDGSNLREIWFDGNMIDNETEIEYDDEYYEDLDEWDGSNWSYNGRFNHGRKYRILTIDGEHVEGKYLIHEWSQYQGSLDTGEIVDEEA